MPTLQNFKAVVANNTHVAISLSAVYNTIVRAPYYNDLYQKNSALHCVFFTANGSGYMHLTDGTKHHLLPNTIFFGRQDNVQNISCSHGDWEFYCYWFNVNGMDIPINSVFSVNDNNEKDFINDIIALITQRQD